jgi:hypothetical protein
MMEFTSHDFARNQQPKQQPIKTLKLVQSTIRVVFTNMATQPPKGFSANQRTVREQRAGECL